MLEDEPQFMPYPPAAKTVGVVRRIHEGTAGSNLSQKQLVSLGIAEGNSDRVQKALRFLGLVDAEGTLTPLAIRLRKATSDEYPTLLAEIVRSAYAPVFVLYPDPGAASAIDMNNAFKPYDPAGQRQNMIALFMALCREASMAQGAAPRIGRPPAPKTNRDTSVAKKTLDQPGRVDPPPPPPGQQHVYSRLHPAVQAWIDEMPDNGTTWDRADFESWLAIFRASVERAYKIEAQAAT